jgi:hypothetical protein
VQKSSRRPRASWIRSKSVFGAIARMPAQPGRSTPSESGRNSRRDQFCRARSYELIYVRAESTTGGSAERSFTIDAGGLRYQVRQ